MNRQSIVVRALQRVTRTWAEMDHAQRRLVEIQAGIEPTARRPR